MKQISTNLLAVLCVMLLLFTACKKNSDFTVEGVVSGADGQMMYLENVGVSTVELMEIQLYEASSGIPGFLSLASE